MSKTKNRQQFDTRILRKDKVYLLAEDCADALGYKNIKEFAKDNPGIIETMDGGD